MMEELEDTKGDRQHNGQKKKDNAMSLKVMKILCVGLLQIIIETKRNETQHVVNVKILYNYD